MVHLRFIQQSSQSSSNLQYSVGLGTTAGADDVKTFDSIEISDVLEVNALQLQINTVSSVH